MTWERVRESEQVSDRACPARPVLRSREFYLLLSLANWSSDLSSRSREFKCLLSCAAHGKPRFSHPRGPWRAPSKDPLPRAPAGLLPRAPRRSPPKDPPPRVPAGLLPRAPRRSPPKDPPRTRWCNRLTISRGKCEGQPPTPAANL